MMHEADDHETVYAMEVAAEMSGVTREVLLSYCEMGLVSVVTDPTDAPGLNDEGVHWVRKMEQMRQTCALNPTALRLMAQLMREVETLQAELRARRW